MKKLSTIIMAIALVIVLAYCKKNETPATPDADINWVSITMRVAGGGRDMDTVYPGTGAVVYENGDIIYVGNSGKYRGMLVYHDGMFSGLVADPKTDDYLHVYYLSGLTPSNFWPYFHDKDTLVPNTTTQFKINIADQSGELPVISYGRSTEPYINDKTAYTCMLMNQCGLVRFVLPQEPSETNDTVTISGMKITATISFGENPGITPNDTTGVVTLHKSKNYFIPNDSINHPKERWAILLPQPETEATVTYYIDNDENPITKTITLPEIKANSFYNGYQVIPVNSL